MTRALFKLEVITSDEGFEGFALADLPSLLGLDDLFEDLIPGHGVTETNRDWKQEELAGLWAPPKVQGDVSAENDFSGINMILPVFSEKACQVLGSMLLANGELLSVNSDAGRYYFYNALTVIDALDVEDSICDFWCEPPTTAVDIERYSFRNNSINGASVFRIIENPIALIVTQEFVNTAKEAGLKGLCFHKIWPFEKGKKWREENISIELK